ncbi:site-specific integrase [Halobellus rufus]|uniref:site-specific integrase n=1 Tax=Halobellus rufus TaxID=1448860 RepID=UPI0006792BF0|nr:site-specific integrase [Halobellus rufus]
MSDSDQIERLRERVRNSPTICDADKETLLTFSDELEFLDVEYTDVRHIKLLQHCILLAGDSEKYTTEELPDVALTSTFGSKDAVKDLGRWIRRNYDNEETKRDYRIALRMLGKRVTEGDDIPEPLQLLSAGTPRSYDPTPDPAKMLWWEDHIEPMIKNAHHLRDKAAIAVAWDSGARSEEFCGLRVGDVSDHEHGMKISVDGKTGERSFLLTTATSYLLQWLNVHPASNDPTAPLWCKLNAPEDTSYRMKLKMLKKPARRAGIEHTDITFRRMRKSSASYLASQNVNQAHLEDHHGWKRGSNIASRYIAVFGEANDREIARAHGVDVQTEEHEPLAPVTCTRCRNETPRNESFCVWCGQAMEHGAVEELEAEKREARIELLRIAREDPTLLDEIDRLEQVVGFVDSNPSILREARDFVDASAD